MEGKLIASKAKELSIENQDVELANILDQIDVAARKGKTSIFLDAITDYCEKSLREKPYCYSVDTRSVATNSVVRISW